MKALIFPNTVGHFELLPSLVYYLNQFEISPIIYNYNGWIGNIRREYLREMSLEFTITNKNPNFSEYNIIIITTYYPDKFPFLEIKTFTKLENTQVFLIIHEHHKKFIDEKPLTNKTHLNLLYLTPHGYQLSQDKTNFNSFYLLPIIFQTPEHAEILDNKPLRILIQGNIQEKRRNYQTLIKLASKFKDRNFVFIIVGRGDKTIREIFKKSTEYDTKFKIFLNLKEKDFYHKIRTCHFIMPLVDETYNHRYFQSKLTSSITIGIGHTLPMIIHTKLADIYEIKDQFIYDSFDTVENAFQSALDVTKEDYSKKKKLLVGLKIKYTEKGSQEFSKIVEKSK